MTTDYCVWFICLEPVNVDAGTKIFGFSEFLTAVALLAILYTIVDVRYKFRIAIAPGALHTTTYVLIAIIGLQTLLTEIWVSERWLVLKNTWLTYSIWQGTFGLLFLGAFLTWMYYAFIRPPIFGPRNALRFGRELYRSILRGNEEELKVIANELARSAQSLIKYSRGLSRREESRKSKKKKSVEAVGSIAHDMLLLIANRKFCRVIVASSPVTAQALFEEMVALSKFNIPIGQFSRNISSEAIAQKGSFLYEESDGYTSGYLGYLKPVTKAVYGNNALVRALAGTGISPLDVDYQERSKWDATQWEAYCRATLITFEAFLESGDDNSYAINRALDAIENSCSDLYELNGAPVIYRSDIYARFRGAVDFAKEAINLIGKQAHPPRPLHRVREGTYPKNIYDHLALMIFNLCFSASTVNSPPENCWSVHYGALWGDIFGRLGEKTAAWKIVQFKVRRLLYDEIAGMTEFPNYKGARILGLCLNVLGMETSKGKQNRQYETHALAKAIHSWARKHYLLMRQEYPDVAESVLLGSVSFDEQGGRLVKSYLKGLKGDIPKSYLYLDPPLGKEGAKTA